MVISIFGDPIPHLINQDRVVFLIFWRPNTTIHIAIIRQTPACFALKNLDLCSTSFFGTFGDPLIRFNFCGSQLLPRLVRYLGRGPLVNLRISRPTSGPDPVQHHRRQFDRIHNPDLGLQVNCLANYEGKRFESCFWSSHVLESTIIVALCVEHVGLTVQLFAAQGIT